MKKFILFGLLLAIVSIMATGCSSCQSEKPTQDSTAVVQDNKDCDGVIPEITASVENCIAVDRQSMYAIADGKPYKWFKTTVAFDQLIGDSTDASNIKVMTITCTFKMIKDECCNDACIYIFSTNGKGTVNNKVETIFDDCQPLDDEEIKISFLEAYEKIMEANTVKPNTRYCTLYKPLGPVNTEPVYSFSDGNITVTVGAKSGEVKVVLKKPLGEWP